VAVFQKGLLTCAARRSPSLRVSRSPPALALVCADARAVRRTEDPIALVPADAATVAVLHWNELKQTPLGERVLANLDHISADDDTARFFRETGLTPARTSTRSGCDVAVAGRRLGARALRGPLRPGPHREGA
jgi:hypothetical protein